MSFQSFTHNQGDYTNWGELQLTWLVGLWPTAACYDHECTKGASYERGVLYIVYTYVYIYLYICIYVYIFV